MTHRMDIGSAGFFLIDLDGTLRPSATLADSAPAPIRVSAARAMELAPDLEKHFLKWLELVRKRHGDMRWDKLAALAPVREIRNAADGHQVRLVYRKLEDSRGRLAAIAVLAVDAAPSAAMDRQLEAERLKHHLEMRDVLALAANPPETVGAFLEDARVRLDSAQVGWQTFLASGKGNTIAVADLWMDSGDESPGQRLFRELHMVKGNAGAFGFEGLAAGAQASENLLEDLRHPSPDRDTPAALLTASLAGLRSQLEEIRRAMKLIAGEGQDAMARILKWKLDRLVAGAHAVDAAALNPQTRGVIEATRRLPFLSPAYLARKYGNLVDRVARQLGKETNFRVTSNSGDIHPESFSRVDEALVHILRNMVDHGIESPSEREAAGKGRAEIGLEYVAQEDRVMLRISDDGRGMDPNVIAGQGVALGLITVAEAEALDDIGKLGLIFMERFTTRSEAGLISGRGLGLALAARCVKDRGGNLYVLSRPGQGARFAIELPHMGQKRLP